MKKVKCTNIGGQAVLEGVMMRGSSSECVSVRDADGIIRTETKRVKPLKDRNFFFRVPIIRGILNFIFSLVDGTNILMRSAGVYGEEEPSAFEKKIAKKLKINVMSVVMTLSVIFAIVMAIGLFILLPQGIGSLIAKYTSIGKTSVWFNLIEGVARIIIFVTYIVLVSLLKDIKRVFMYHGAEHKTINCYESGLDLTVENVKKSSRIHDRCGTTFLFYVMIISILLFSIANSFFKLEGWQRILLKISMLPLVAGVSYEVLKLLAKTQNPVVNVLKFPGLLLQKITTKEPDEKMIEVALCSFNTVMQMDADLTIEPKAFVTSVKTNVLANEIKERFTSNGIDVSDGEWLISVITEQNRSDIYNSEKYIRPLLVERIQEGVDRRLKGEPLQYILGDTSFYGYTIKCDARALIPRPETEEVVEKALELINDQSEVLDLCSGSGCIGITVAKQKCCHVTCADISENALSLVKENAQLNGVEINTVCSDMFNSISGQYDIIISNPPYIKSEDISGLEKELTYEPLIALDGGADGLDFYRIIAQNAKSFLKQNGKIVLELGIGQAESIIKMFAEYSGVKIYKDLNGVDRIAVVES